MRDNGANKERLLQGTSPVAGGHLGGAGSLECAQAGQVMQPELGYAVAVTILLAWLRSGWQVKSSTLSLAGEDKRS